MGHDLYLLKYKYRFFKFGINECFYGHTIHWDICDRSIEKLNEINIKNTS